jgi:hypothetical protein
MQASRPISPPIPRQPPEVQRATLAGLVPAPPGGYQAAIDSRLPICASMPLCSACSCAFGRAPAGRARRPAIGVRHVEGLPFLYQGFQGHNRAFSRSQVSARPDSAGLKSTCTAGAVIGATGTPAARAVRLAHDRGINALL